jgi:hypothetical protein
MHHQGHVVSLAMMITGIVMSKKAQLAAMSSKVPVAAKDESIDTSLFRLGLDCLKYILKHGLPIDVHFLFQPALLEGNVR